MNARIESPPSLDSLLETVRACRACVAHLPLGPRPVLQAGATARILIVGQAPGARVHASGVPWDDRSGERLRAGADTAQRLTMTPTTIAASSTIHPMQAR